MSDELDTPLELELTDALEEGDEGEPTLEHDAPLAGEQGEGEELHISFGDDDGEEEPADPTIRSLRKQVREAQRTIAKLRGDPPTAQADDPEPVIPPVKRLADFEYDEDKADAYNDARIEAARKHAEWTARQTQREAQARRAAEEQTKQVERRVKELGVSRDEYLISANRVRDVLSEAQLANLIQTAGNEARMILALGRSNNDSILTDLAATDNMFKFAGKIGKLENELKMSKRKAPPPPGRVSVGSATAAIGNTDRRMAELEKEAEKTGDRTKIAAYRRELRNKDKAS